MSNDLSSRQDRAPVSAAQLGTAQMWFIFSVFGTVTAFGLNLVKDDAPLPLLPSDLYLPGFSRAVGALVFLALLASFFVLRHLRDQGAASRAMLLAFTRLTGLLTSLSLLLCLFFAESFYDFDRARAGASTGASGRLRLPNLPGFDIDAGWSSTVPAEFYLLVAFLPLLVLSVYLLLCLFFVREYTIEDAAFDPKRAASRDRINPRHIWVLAGLMLLVTLINKSHLADQGMRGEAPSHLWFLILGIGVPSMLLSQRGRELVNWRAYTITCFAAVIVGIVWEASLGARVGWWKQEAEVSLGLFLEAWGYLALEAPLFWIFVSLPIILAYEAMRARLLERAPSAPAPAKVTEGARARTAALMLAAITAAAVITLVEPIPSDIADSVYQVIGETVPRAYTYSLLLFVLPSSMMIVWLFHARRQEHVDRLTLRAVGLAGLIMAVTGFVLDSGLGMVFFLFENQDSVLGFCSSDKPVSEASLLCLPAYNWHLGRWVAGIPLEEFLFYSLGSVFVLTSYLWLCLHFVGRSGPAGHSAPPGKALGALIRVHRRGLLIILGLLSTAFVIRAATDRMGDSVPEGGIGIPGYAIFQILCLGLPVVLLFHAVNERINWVALFLVCSQVLVLGMVWEAALGVPYRWWNYQEPAMMGLYIVEWGGLPLEAVSLWFLIALPTIFLFEVLRLILRDPSA